MLSIVLLLFFTSKLQTSDAQYPNHMDLQKVGEAIFNNEKFNILKPTTHIISDYFKEFMLRRENTDFPTKRVFIDKNGFRHFWSGFGSTSKSLRKTDDINSNLIINTASNKKNNNIITFGIEDIKILNAETFIMPPKGRRNIKSKIKKLALRDGGNEDEEKAEEKTTKANDVKSTDKADEVKTTVKADEVKTTVNADEVKTTVKADVETVMKMSGDEIITKADDESTTAKATTKSKAQPKAGERVVAKTTFFCPYFGVITMAAFID